MNDKDIKHEDMCMRPHHLLCTQTFRGKGYSSEFVRYMTSYVTRMKQDPDFSVRITNGADDLCAHCPNLREKQICESEEKVQRYDRAVRKYLNLAEGERYRYRDLVQILNRQAPDSHRNEICPDCAWYGLCKSLGIQ